MRFAEATWLWGMACSLLIVGLLALGGVRLARSRARFGTEGQLAQLLTARGTWRRTTSAVLVTLAVALVFVAAAQPQYGRGTRVLPRTNLDVVLVLDYSKSMYARDVAPSRIERAKIEVARLVKKLGGARFGAVAFAGEPLAFPLSSDGAAIAQFFRGLDPHDMPIGGTAIALALEAGQELFARDSRSKNHEKVLILVTDGEDLEGDPVHAAEEAASQGIRIEVIQIGGRSPEPIPDVDERGIVTGMRKDSSGNILTTALSAEGEAQLRAVASAGHGSLHIAEQGEVGVDAIGDELRTLMKEELSERVETVYADVFHYPLALAVLLLCIEGFIGTSARRITTPEPPRGKRARRLPKRLRATAVVLAVLSSGCAEVDKVFERNSPVVDEAIEALKANEHARATELLTGYLETGACEAGVIGAGDRARSRGDAAFDLGLAFSLAHAGQKPGAGSAPGLVLPPGVGPMTPAPPAPQGEPKADDALIECGLRLLGPLAESTDHPAALRARAFYLMGNLETARKSYRAAVTAYDKGLLLTPGQPDGPAVDPIGRDLAHNRAFALRHALEEEEKKKKEEEQKSKSEPQDPAQKPEDQKDKDGEPEDQDKDGKPDEGQDQKDKDGKPEDQKDPGQEQGQSQQDKDGKPQDPGQDGKPEDQPGQDPKEQVGQDGKPQPGADGKPQDGAAAQASAGKPPAPSASQDDRVLDLFEQAQTLQQQQARQRAAGRVGRAQRGTMEDK